MLGFNPLHRGAATATGRRGGPLHPAPGASIPYIAGRRLQPSFPTSASLSLLGFNPLHRGAATATHGPQHPPLRRSAAASIPYIAGRRLQLDYLVRTHALNRASIP